MPSLPSVRRRLRVSAISFLLLATPAIVAAQSGPMSPAFTRDCGAGSGSPLWQNGAVFVDTTNLVSRYRQIVAASWCVYLASGSFEPYAYLARWTDLQHEEGLTFDAGIDWARAASATFNNSRISFRVDQVDSGRVDRFIVTSTIERADAARWTVAAIHRIPATVSKDTARFESPFASTLKTSLRYIASPIEFVRLDGGAVDTARANAAAAFLTSVQRRLGITSPSSEDVLYFYTTAGNGRDILGFSQFDAPIEGFTSRVPVPYAFVNIPAAGEAYWHELVRVALSKRSTALDPSLSESLANALGGIGFRTWPQFVCEARSPLLGREAVKDIPSLFAKADAQLLNTTTREWETAFLIDYLTVKAGDGALRTLVSGQFNFATRSAARASVAGILGITPSELVQQVSAYYSDKDLSQRCTGK